MIVFKKTCIMNAQIFLKKNIKLEIIVILFQRVRPDMLKRIIFIHPETVEK